MLPIPDLGPEMGEMFLYFDEFGYTGGEAGVVLAQDVRSFPFFLSLCVQMGEDVCLGESRALTCGDSSSGFRAR